MSSLNHLTVGDVQHSLESNLRYEFVVVEIARHKTARTSGVAEIFLFDEEVALVKAVSCSFEFYSNSCFPFFTLLLFHIFRF